MTSIPDHYQALGIDPTADPEVITAAYRALAKKFHPDTGAATGTASPERFDAIQQAYEVLRNPDSRHAYYLELLAAAEAELEQHLAAKRRVVVAEPAAAAEAERAYTPPPDLGDIRPEPAMPPRGKPAAAAGPRRSMSVFAVPLLLMFAVGGGAAWLFLPVGPAAPPQPSITDAKQSTETKQASPPVAKPEAVADATPAPAPATATAPAPAPAAAPAAADDTPMFGSTGAEADPPEVEVAAATPTAGPASDAGAAINSAAKSDRPSFGSGLEEDNPAAAADAPADAPADVTAPPPVPKARPKQPKPPQKTQAQAKVQPQGQPKAKLSYQNPPRYNPQPDGYPPPGYPPPGYEPPGYDPAYDPGYDPRAEYDPPPGYEGDYPPPGYQQGGLPGLGPYRLVIFERQPGRQATAWSAGVVFKSIGKCTRQGVKAVLRRTGGTGPDGTRIWYECQQLSQR